MASKRRKKITRAGRIVRISIYTPPNGIDTPRQRSAKRKASSEAQKVHNRKVSREKAEDLLAENFDIGDVIVTLTYDDAHYPASRSAAESRLKKWMAAVRQTFQAMHNPAPVIFWVTEEKHGDGRLHHHVVINAPKNCYGILRNCWKWGTDVDIKKLRVDKEKDYESLAWYLTKEGSDRPGKHQWHISKNAGRPDVYSTWVSGSEMITPPKGSRVLRSGGDRDDRYGAFYQYAVFLLPIERRKPKKKK